MYAPVHILPEMDDSGLPDEDVFFEAQRSPSEVHMSDEEIRIYRKAKHVMLYVSLHVCIMHESLTLSLYLLFFASFYYHYQLHMFDDNLKKKVFVILFFKKNCEY